MSMMINDNINQQLYANGSKTQMKDIGVMHLFIGCSFKKWQDITH